MTYRQAPQHEPPGVPRSAPVYYHEARYRTPGGHDTYAYEHTGYSAGYTSPRDATNRPLPNYKPPALRWTSLGIVVAVILGYIALTEYALQRLPRESGRREISDYSELERRFGPSQPGVLAPQAMVGFSW